MIKKTCSAVFAASVFLFILSFSIALPICLRPFYYLHIGPLNLEAQGFTYSQIVDSYNAVLDYLTLPNKEFSAGVMAFSESGADHFADCKALFTLDFTVLICSGILIITFLLLRKFGKLSPLKLGRRSSFFYGAVAAIAVPTIVGIFAAIDFTAVFNAFHKIFFSGKDNWIFDRTKDEIIKVLPQVFFRNCAILIGISILVISLTIIIKELKNRDV